MKRLLSVLFLSVLVAVPLAAVDEVAHVARALAELGELPGVSGYEERVTQWLMQRLKEYDAEVDNLGNVTVTLGSGAPHRLIVTPIDEPGYVVSAITADGYLRVQRLPQAPPSAGQAGVHPWFDLLHSTQPVQILTRQGELVPGIVAGLSTHLHRDLGVDDRTDTPERLYIDVGARSAEEVRVLGVDLLDPITLEKEVYALQRNQRTAPFLSERVGAAALVRLIEGMDASKLQGTLTVAFVTRRYIGNQGLDRLVREQAADEMIFVQRLEKSEAQIGAGALVATIEGSEPALAADLLAAMRGYGSARAELAEAAPRGRYSGALPLPDRVAVVGVPVKFPQTPGEVVSAEDVTRLEELLARYLGVTLGQAPATGGSGGGVGVGDGGVEVYLRSLSTVYGVSGYESAVAEEVRKQLPAWAQEWATLDAAGNLIVPFGRESDKPSLVFVAHVDEIGWVVREIREDGSLVLDRRGGFLEEHFLGHAVLVHTEKGPVPAVLELPEAYRTERYRPVRDRDHVAYTGAHNREWIEQQGVRVGDSVSVPKKFRHLAGTRVSARSFDDRVGSTALVAALHQLDPAKVDREVIFVWAVREEIGLEGAKHFAERAAEQDGIPDFVFAVDTFVSGDSPLESPRFAQGFLGQGFVVRAVDNSNVAPRRWVDRVVEIARKNSIPVQYGVTSGGNDGAAFVPYGSVDVPLGWPLRYSHSPGEVADLKDVEALARIVAALVREF
ncbi:MAG: M20/M25/M40 family metallo-hydrolase [Candidatus Acidiferrales bacterium]